MSSLTLLPATDLLHLDSITSESDRITLVASTVQPRVACPLCGHSSERIHSRYTRTLADLPWQGIAVHLQLKTRRFFCDQPSCKRVVFTELLPQVALRYARRTDRMAQALHLIGYALGGEAGARLAQRLGLGASPDTLLRHLTQKQLTQNAATASPPSASVPVPRVLGVDDWAYRKGHRYGTLLVDLERHGPVDLLADREASTLAAWLKAHSGVEVISRDRASAYAEGARQGAPNAVQVADRWHLLKNLGDAVARSLLGHGPHLCEAAQQLEETEPKATENPTVGTTVEIEKQSIEKKKSFSEQKSRSIQKMEQQSAHRREKRLAQYTQIHELRRQSLTIEAIAIKVGVGGRTVQRFLEAETFPERSKRRRSARPVDAFSPYLNQRWNAGCHNAAQLFREVKAQGFGGSYATVWEAVQNLSAKSSGNGRASPIPSSYQVAYWLQGYLSPKPEVRQHQTAFLERLYQRVPSLQEAGSLAKQFTQIVVGRKASELPVWLEQARQCPCAELRLFATSLRQDLAAVTAALTSEWSNGQTEGQVNRLKTIKRQMYGRAGFALLRARVLPAC